MNVKRRRSEEESTPSILESQPPSSQYQHSPFMYHPPNSSDIPSNTDPFTPKRPLSGPSPRHGYPYPPSPSPESSPPTSKAISLPPLQYDEVPKSLKEASLGTPEVPISPPLKARSRLRGSFWGGPPSEKPPSTASTSYTGYTAHTSAYQQSLIAKSLLGEVTTPGEDGVLKRDWDWFASWSMGMLNVGFLPGVFFGVLTAREYGGSGMIAIGWPLAGIFMTGLVTVLSEFSGAYPVAGAMFTWVFRLCRVTSSPFKGSARFLSWLAGSFLLCSHILAQVALSWQFAVVIQGCVKVYITSYQGTMWRTVAIAWGNIFFCAAFVSMPVSRSPYLWRCAGCLLIFAFLFFNISLLAAAPNKRSAYDIFTSYENDTGFSTKGYVYLLGWVLTTLATGMDACAHMAEETRAPARTVPSSMFWTSVGSYIMGWISLCVYLACDNTPPPGSNRADSGEAVVNVTPTVEISWEPSRILITNLSPALTVTTLALILAVMILQDIAQLLASSRFVWALARDKAIPLSPFFRRLSKNLLPLHATWVVGSVVFVCLLLITVNRDLVNNLMVKGTGVAIFIAYIFPVIVYLCCDSDSLVVDGRNLWTVRGFVRPLSYVSTLFVVFILVCMSFPTNLPLTALTFPWAPVVGIGVLCLSTLSWIFYGNSRYAGPIKATLGPSVELPKSQPRSSRPDDNSNSSEDRHGKTAQVWVRSLSTIHTSGEQLHEITSVTHQPKFEYQGRIQRIPPPGLPKDEEAVAIAVETERRIQRLQPPGHAQENLGVDSVDAEREGFPWNILSR